MYSSVRMYTGVQIYTGVQMNSGVQPYPDISWENGKSAKNAQDSA